MNIIGNLMRTLRSSNAGQRTWTITEVRELIERRDFEQASAAAECLAEIVDDREAEQASLRGEIAFHQSRDADAAAALRIALEQVPGLPSAHYGMSLLLAAQGSYDDAARHAQFAVGSCPKEPRYLAQVGYCHLCIGNYQAAENPLRRATLSMAGNAYLWNNLGIVLDAIGALDEARLCFKRALSLNPEFESARQHLDQLEARIVRTGLKASASKNKSHALQPKLGVLEGPGLEAILELEQSGELQEAIDRCELLLLEQPDDQRAPVLLARLYERVGDLESAVDTLQAQLSTHPDALIAAGALGLVAIRAQNFSAAEPLLRRAVKAEPDHLDYVVGLARALSGQERFAEAGPWFEIAEAMAPQDFGLLGERASNLANQCRYQESMDMIDELTARGLSVGCKGSVLSYLGRFEEALAALDQDVASQPSDPTLRFQRAHLNLLLENYADGWDDYGFRGLSVPMHFRMLPFPTWRGESLEGKRVIVLAEQGLGDQIMFASCLPDLLAQAPAQVVVEMSERVAKTIGRSFSNCEVVATKQSVDLEWVKAYPQTDCFIPLADLPAHFRRSREAFPHHSGYLRADPARVAHWRAELEARGRGPYIGLSWRGGTELTRTSLRSLTPEQLLPLAAATSATWVCLQYGDVQPEVDRMAETPMPMQYWPESIADLDEFAALITALDLVVTVCNTTVHYAGALGKAVWVMSPRVPEWRYGLSSAALPWYPSSRMFRQAEAGKWEAPIEAICQEMSAGISQ